jgi:acetate---CoA ligase (ADP-forming)
VRIQPLTDVDARDMVRSIKGYPLLQGWRGSPPADIAALEDLLLRVSSLAGDLPEIAEMDLNPVRVLSPGEGAVVVDARMLLRPIS